MKNFLRLKKLEEAKAKRTAAKKAMALETNLTANQTSPYANGRRSTEEDAKKRQKNKTAVNRRVKLLIRHQPNDLLGIKWKVRHICRWNSAMQNDPADALAMAIGGLAQVWQKEFDDYDERYKKAEQNAGLAKFLK